MAAPARRLGPGNGARAATIRQSPMPALTNASCPAPNSPDSLCNGSRPASAPRKDSPDTARLCRTAPGSSAGRSVDRPATCDALSVAREHLSAASRELKPEGYREAVCRISGIVDDDIAEAIDLAQMVKY